MSGHMKGRMSRMKIHEMLKIIYEDTTMYGYNAKAYKYNINRIFYTKITDSMGNTTLIPMQQWNNEPPEHLSIGNAELKYQDAWEVAKRELHREPERFPCSRKKNAGTRTVPYAETGTVPYETDEDGNELDDNTGTGKVPYVI